MGRKGALATSCQASQCCFTGASAMQSDRTGLQILSPKFGNNSMVAGDFRRIRSRSAKF